MTINPTITTHCPRCGATMPIENEQCMSCGGSAADQRRRDQAGIGIARFARHHR